MLDPPLIVPGGWDILLGAISSCDGGGDVRDREPWPHLEAEPRVATSPLRPSQKPSRLALLLSDGQVEDIEAGLKRAAFTALLQEIFSPILEFGTTLFQVYDHISASFSSLSHS